MGKKRGMVKARNGRGKLIRGKEKENGNKAGEATRVIRAPGSPALVFVFVFLLIHVIHMQFEFQKTRVVLEVA